ncbi:hypothetical protein KCP71_01960 [Salmonella enterica subsp. enterica]|nr:hypothetical protein KCP71_01960 [Salmonella enterica subsp. enterica]
MAVPVTGALYRWKRRKRPGISVAISILKPPSRYWSKAIKTPAKIGIYQAGVVHTDMAIKAEALRGPSA